MNILSKLSTISALALLSLTATAATVCDHCEYIYYVRYLGAYWPGDNGTFANKKIVADLVRNVLSAYTWNHGRFRVRYLP